MKPSTRKVDFTFTCNQESKPPQVIIGKGQVKLWLSCTQALQSFCCLFCFFGLPNSCLVEIHHLRYLSNFSQWVSPCFSCSDSRIFQAVPVCLLVSTRHHVHEVIMSSVLANGSILQHVDDLADPPMPPRISPPKQVMRRYPVTLSESKGGNVKSLNVTSTIFKGGPPPLFSFLRGGGLLCNNKSRIPTLPEGFCKVLTNLLFSDRL